MSELLLSTTLLQLFSLYFSTLLSLLSTFLFLISRFIDTITVCKTALQNVISHNGSSDNPKRQHGKEIQSLKDKQRESSDKKGNNERSSRITSSTKMKIKREIKKRNVDSKLKSVEN
jgi:hypothetical protein